MKNRIIKLAAVAGILVFSVTSCLKDDSEEQRAEEMRILENYIISKNIQVQPSESGLYYIETLAGTGDSAKTGTWMEINFTGRLLASENVIMTSSKTVAVDNGIYSAGAFYGPTRLIQGFISYQGLNEGIARMREGGKARLIFPSELGLGSRSTYNIPAYSSMIFDIELVRVIPDIRSHETGLLMSYLQENGISTDSTASGIYYKETEAGEGNLPEYGDDVVVTYTGKFLDGTIFDSSGKSYTFKMGYHTPIPGFEAGVAMMKKGGSATIVIPYYYAYGEYGRVDSNYRTLIPPFTTLVFDLSLTNISK